MRSLSVKQRHIIIICMVVLGFLLSGAINSWSHEKLSNLEELRRSYLQFDSLLLTLRRHEKDFLSRKDNKYVDQFSGVYTQGIELVDSIHQLELQADLPLDEELQGLLKDYGDGFLELSNHQNSIGLHSKDGLYGGLRSSIHKVEVMIESEPALLVDLLMLRRHEKDFMLRLDEKYFNKFENTLNDLTLKLDALYLSEAHPLLLDYKNKFSELVKAEKTKGLTPKEGLRGNMRSAAHELASRFKEKLQVISTVVDAQVKTMNIISSASLLVIGISLIILVTWISHSISKAIKQLVNSTLSLISDKKTKSKIMGNNNELAVLGESVQYLHDQLQYAFSKFESAANHIKQVSTEMLDVTSDVKKTTEDEHIKIQQSAAAINEMNASIHEVAANAQRSSDYVRDVNDRLTSTTQMSAVAQEAISTLQSELEHAVGAITELETASQSTESVLDSIEDIASQTNLLALNAAIEAARAGDQGRGFAVVADEVRTLSIRTAESTDEVRTTLRGFQTVINEVVNAIQSSNIKGETGKEQSNSALQLLREMSQSMAEVSMMNLQIASAVEEQSASAQEIVGHIDAIQISSDSVKDKAAQTQEESNKLSAVANLILETVGSIHV